MESISPVKPVAPYIGGKFQLAKRLCAKIDALDHECYVEPFIGMGGVFFRRRRRPKAEVINDLSRDVANLFRILQRHYPQFLDCLKFQITSRAEFERLIKCAPETLTDLERAARFLYLQKAGFAGKVAGRTFGTSTTGPARFNLTTLEPLLRDAHERLSGVVIESLPYQDCIARYDRPHSLFYIDPPYWGVEGYYGKELFTREDFQRLADQLAALKGRFILSLNDTEGVRETFKAFQMETAELTHSVSDQGHKRVTELIIEGP